MAARRRGLRAVAGLVALVMATAVLAIGTSASAGPVPPPASDPFYTPPAGFEAQPPGTILRSRPVTVKALALPLPVKAWQTLARSTDTKGNPIAVVSTIMVPVMPYLFGKRPLLSHQVAIDGLGDQCNPSYTLRSGTLDGNGQIELGQMVPALLKGWAVVTTDFEGPRNAYGAGRVAGQAVLDGIRAALRLPGTGLAGAATPVGLSGYSGGGQATSWAAELHPTYAPELNVKGITSGGTPADLNLTLRKLDGSPFAGIMLAAVVGASREYPELDLDTLLNPAGHALVQQIGDQCIDDFILAHPNARLANYTTAPDPLSLPVAQSVIADASLGHATPKAPVYLYHSIFDELIPIAGTDALRNTWCAGGGNVTYWRDPASEHITLAATGAPGAILFHAARFAGLPAPNGCG